MKMQSLFAIAMAVICLFGRAPAQSLDDANRAFAAGQYHDSTLTYQAVLARDGYSAPILFDLGNSYVREGDLAHAILAYRRAQWLTPGDPDITANLHYAEKGAGLPVAEPRRGDRISHVLSASGWAWLASASWITICASLLACAFLPRRANAFSFAAIGAAFVLTVSLAGAVFASDALREAIVVDKNAAGLISPFPAAQTVFSPAAGETVTIQKVYNDYVLVTDHTGHTGWINQAQLARIVPS